MVNTARMVSLLLSPALMKITANRFLKNLKTVLLLTNSAYVAIRFQVTVTFVKNKTLFLSVLNQIAVLLIMNLIIVKFKDHNHVHVVSQFFYPQKFALII